MSKQDRQGVRTPADLERKYSFGDIKKNSDNQIVQLNQLKQDFAKYQKSVSIDIEKINQFMAETDTKFEDLEENDKMWFYSGAPTLENYPAVDWTTDELKAKHMGDMYYDIDNGNMYIFKNIDGAYSWESCFGSGGSYDEGYNAGYTDGQNNVTNPLEYVSNMDYAYQNVVFPTDFEMCLKIPNIKTLANAFNGASNVKKITLVGNDNGNVVSFNRFLRGCASIQTLDLTEFNAKINNLDMAFFYCINLKKILGELDLSECTAIGTNAFVGMSNLIEIRFKALSINLSISFSASSLLSAKSVQSIIDGLADLTGADAQTITFHSSIVLTDEQKATISSKNWTLVQ